MALHLEETITWEDGAGHRHQVEIWQEHVSRSANMDGKDRLAGLRQAFVVDPPPRRRLNAIEGGAAQQPA